MRTLKIHLDGMALGSMKGRAEKALKSHREGSRAYITAWNGAVLYIKTRSGVRQSTDSEWNEFQKQSMEVK